MRRTPRLEEAIPVLYLRGLSTSDFKEALATLFGQEAVTGFSASTVTQIVVRVARRLQNLAQAEANSLSLHLHLGRWGAF